MNDELLFRCLIGRASAEEVAAATAWRRVSQENEDHYADLARILDLLAADEASKQPGPAPSLAELMARVEVAALVRPREARPVGAARGTGWRRFANPRLLAAAVAVVALSTLLGLRVVGKRVGAAAHEIISSGSAAATVELYDGSVVRLAPRSRLEVMPNSGGRSVTLDGRGYFVVAHRDGAPFRIRTTAGEVVVTGTRFDLEAQSRDLRLLVVDGRVTLSSGGSETNMTAGQMAQVVGGAPVRVVRVPEVRSFVDWVGNFLAFQETPLRDAVREIEQRFGVQIRLADSALGDRTVSAWFADWNLQEVMDVVCVVTSARCTVDGNAVTMQRRE